MQRLLEFLETKLSGAIRWVIEHAPLPAKLRRALDAKQDVLGELVKFFIAGLVATVVFLAVFNGVLVAWPKTAKWVANLIANVPAIAASYVVSSTFVFKTQSRERRHFEVAMFFVFAGIAVAVATSALAIVEWAVGHDLSLVWANLVVFTATLFNWSSRFLTSKFLVFKSHLERPPMDVATELAHLAEEVDEEAADAKAGGPGV